MVKIEKHTINAIILEKGLLGGYHSDSRIPQRTAKAAKEIYDSRVPVTLKICRLKTIM